MDFDALRTAILGFVETHKAWAPLVVGVLAFCESLAFLSILVPATVLMLGIGAMIGASGIPFWPVVIGGGIGAALGDWVSYEIGRYFQHGAKTIWPMSRYPDMVAKGEDFCRRYGAWGIVIGRFIGPARAVVPLIAGIFEVPRVPFQLANWSSGFLWAFIWLAPTAGVLSFFKG
ncbi:MAG: DedA family protein [Methylobacterium sp.]|uniref:DedA family protein n=1 Tax=Methylobacterium sp. TaxID=409 RepID=UPI0025FD4C6F|nr:DedA family protein [Methylobacterium sp.]MBX9932222.1 DedA family protein [Methylobacterium sp.]